jgi:transcriptional regulator with XRE-family HTH domain
LVETSVFGEALKRAREERGVALDAVASATRIARHHLDALERGDLESLPSGPFGRSYLRSYAEFLGIDPEPILDSYRSKEADKGLGPAERRERAARELSRLLEQQARRKGKRLSSSWILAAGAVGIAASALWWTTRGPEAPRALEPPVIEEPAMAEEPPPPVEEPEPAPAQAPSATLTLSVSEAALGTGIVDHTLTGRANRFSEGERVAFWTRVLATSPGEVIHHYWLHGGRTVMKAELRIGGLHWRTFSRYTLPKGSIGTWVVEARDRSGRVLAREEFLCVEGGGG